MAKGTLVILGATGDLTRRLLMPALYQLHALGRLEGLRLVGYAMEAWGREEFIAHLEEGLRQFAQGFDAGLWEPLAARMDYVSGDLSAQRLGALRERLTPSAVFYLALPQASSAGRRKP